MRVMLSAAVAFGLALPPAAAWAAPKVCGDCVKSNMATLAAPAMRGRACGTADENRAAAFLAERLKAYGVKGAAADGGYLQRIELRSPTYSAPPVLEVAGARLVHGEEMVAIDTPDSLVGPLTRIGLGEAAGGKVALLDGAASPAAVRDLLRRGAAAVIAEATPQHLSAWSEIAEQPPRGTEIEGIAAPALTLRPIIYVRPQAFAALRGAVGSEVRLSAPRGAPTVRTTYNVLGVIPGRAKDADARSILLSAHYDHVGVRGGVIYPGANDDASGTAAVLEFARQMAAPGGPPRRTVHVALFGCEEEGGHGAKHWIAHPPAPLDHISANLQFEMIGVPDPADRKALMLTGWERSNLGPTLREKGASLGPDRYPEQNFFQRSDNYQLALRGVVAQTVSAWPLPPTYHRPTDTIENLDLDFMVEVVQSLAGPIRWLADSDFVPAWNPGMRP